MFAEMPDPSLLALKHQACRPEVGRCAQKGLACLGLTNMDPSENGSGASAKSSAVPGPKSALQLANPGTDCRVVRALLQMKVSRRRSERQVIDRKQALKHFPTRTACAGSRCDVVGDPGSQIKFERWQAVLGAGDGCRQCFLCRPDGRMLLVKRSHRPHQAGGQKHDPERENAQHTFRT